MVDITETGGSFDFFETRVRVAVAEIFLDGAGKEPSVLENHAEEIANVFTAHFFGGDTIDGNVAGGRIIETHKEIDDGGFAGAGRTNDGDLLAWGDFG